MMCHELDKYRSVCALSLNTNSTVGARDACTIVPFRVSGMRRVPYHRRLSTKCRLIGYVTGFANVLYRGSGQRSRGETMRLRKQRAMSTYYTFDISERVAKWDVDQLDVVNAISISRANKVRTLWGRSEATQCMRMGRTLRSFGSRSNWLQSSNGILDASARVSDHWIH